MQHTSPAIFNNSQCKTRSSFAVGERQKLPLKEQSGSFVKQRLRRSSSRRLLCILPMSLVFSSIWLQESVMHLSPVEPVCAASSTTSIHWKTSLISKGISLLLFTSGISGRDDDAQKLLNLLQATHMWLRTKYTRHLKVDPEIEKWDNPLQSRASIWEKDEAAVLTLTYFWPTKNMVRQKQNSEDTLSEKLVFEHSVLSDLGVLSFEEGPEGEQYLRLSLVSIHAVTATELTDETTLPKGTAAGAWKFSLEHSH